MRTLTTLAALTSLSASLAACLGEVPTSRKAARKTASTTACTRLDKDLTIRAAADLAALPKTGCYDVYGKLSLQGSQVTSLAMLGGINSVDELELDHTALTTVDAKQAIGLYGKLTVTGNAKLTSLTNLTFEAASTGILIDANPALATVDALGLDQPKLTEVRGDLVITGNAALATLPLRNLTKVTGALTVRPLGWLFVRDAVTWRRQRSERALDFLGNDAQLGVEADRGVDRSALRYELSTDLLAGASYLVAHRLAADYRRELEPVAVVAAAGVRYRGFRQAAQAGFVGWVVGAEAGVAGRPAGWLELDVRATAARELTADPLFSAVALGGQLAAQLRLGGRARLAVLASAAYARYVGADATGALRRDGHGELAADLEVDLADHALATCGASAVGNASTIEDFRYQKLVARCGVALAWGGP